MAPQDGFQRAREAAGWKSFEGGGSVGRSAS